MLVICHLSFVICHLSFVICHLSFVICHLLAAPSSPSSPCFFTWIDRYFV
ncbi:hypothetical protein LC605_22365 [Nostoc sp. CHAB 5836]|nr:hypothetical protein [Nostoc sp. CHAB 5836]